MAGMDDHDLPGLQDLPNAPKVTLAPNASVQPPLSRRGHGPGLIVVDPSYDLPYLPSAEPPSKTLDPVPQYKWAEEGYAVVRIAISSDLGDDIWTLTNGGLAKAIGSLQELDTCDSKDKFALIVYGTADEYPPSFAKDLADAVAACSSIVASVSFSPSFKLATPSQPQLIHLPGPEKLDQEEGISLHSYPEVSSSDFVMPHRPGFSYSAAAVSHTRSVGFVKKHLGGPIFDLEKIWEEHTYWEFENRSVEQTMATMVREPYVNHITTMTGGIGRKKLTDFYRNHFIFSNPPDTGMELVSRTVGVDRIVDEFIMTMKHDTEVDWFIPGIPPTGLPLRVPFYAIVNVRGDRLYHEHISWDQGTVLRQLGMMPEYLPYPHPFAAKAAKKLECKAPVAGAETAMKLQDQNSVESNTLFCSTDESIREC